MKRYSIGGVFSPVIVVEIDGVPPCFWCGLSVERPSMDGPLVCWRCDMGVNTDGSRWTSEQHAANAQRFCDSIERYRVPS